VAPAESQPTPPSSAPAAASEAEQRAAPRDPAGSSFVPGLVHELRNFSFGISGSLDAFQARFGALEGADRYGAVMRASLGRLNAFLDELADYGDPRAHPWTDLDLEALLREAAAHCAGAAGPGRLRLEVRAPLPRFRGDGPSLARALIHLIGLLLGHPDSTGPVTVRAGAGPEPAPALHGQVECAGLELVGVDLARLFEPFYYRAHGFGRLALPVARRVFERQGGTLAAAAVPGGGIRLEFTLPAGN